MAELTAERHWSERYLTSAEKRAVLKNWRRTLGQPAPEGDQPGRGFPDADVIPWCGRLNAIPGVCTIQSCAGHRNDDGTLTTAGVWIRLDEKRAKAFHARAFELAAQAPHIERVAVVYTSWGQEIATIDFAGNERGLLADSLEILVTFARSL